MEIVPMLDDTYEQTQSTISEIMSDDLMKSPEHKLGMAIREAFDGLDTIMQLANEPATRSMVQSDLILLDQIKSRLEWLGTFIMTAQAAKEQQGKIRMVVNRG